jgi:HSP90 family molecular chaperone
LEINPRHPLVLELKRRVEEDSGDKTSKDIAKLMYETAALQSGFALEDPTDFAQRIVMIMNLSTIYSMWIILIPFPFRCWITSRCNATR